MNARRKLLALFLVSLAGASLAAACGGDEESATPAPDTDGAAGDGTIEGGTPSDNDGAVVTPDGAATDGAPSTDATTDGTVDDASADGGPDGAIVDAGADACDGGRCPVPCGTGTCSPGSCCVGNACVPSGKSCGNNQVCTDGTCVGCGAAGQACCANNTCSGGACCGIEGKCVGANAACGFTDGGGLCNAGSCGGCGGPGEPCCDVAGPNACSSPDTVCSGGLGGDCLLCGKAGQPCCAVNTCESGGCCVNGLCRNNGATCGVTTCKDHSCGDGGCGNVGQPCCGAGNQCTAPNTRCLNDNCISCGGYGQRCCPNPQNGQPTFCEAPYTATIDNNVCFCRP